MSSRDKILGKDGKYLKVYLRQEEIALAYAALTWMAADLDSVASLSEPGEMLPEQIPADVFKFWLPLITSVQESLIVQSIADCDERKDTGGKKRMEQTIDDMSNRLEKTQMLKIQVIAACYDQASKRFPLG